MKYMSNEDRAAKARTIGAALSLADVVGWRFDDRTNPLLVAGPFLVDATAELLISVVAPRCTLAAPGLDRAMAIARSDALIVRSVGSDGSGPFDWFFGRWTRKGSAWGERARAWIGEGGEVAFVEREPEQAFAAALAVGRAPLRSLSSPPWRDRTEESAGYARAAAVLNQGAR